MKTPFTTTILVAAVFTAQLSWATEEEDRDFIFDSIGPEARERASREPRKFPFPELISVDEDTGTEPLLMATIGDSLSAGSLANLSFLREKEAQGMKPSEIRAKFNWKEVFNNKTTLSWASGKEINSHFMSLRNYLMEHNSDAKLYNLNVSIPSGLASDMPAQAEQVAQEIRTGEYRSLIYVTVMIGANDACSDKIPGGTPNSEFQAHLMQALEKLSEIRQSERIRVLVMGIPNLPELGRPKIRESKTIFGMKCKAVRDGILKFCNSMTVWSTETERLSRQSVVEDKNQQMRLVVQEAQRKFPNLDLVFTNALFGQPILNDMLTVDCFHPSIIGQEGIADLLWNDQPWFK